MADFGEYLPFDAVLQGVGADGAPLTAATEHNRWPEVAAPLRRAAAAAAGRSAWAAAAAAAAPARLQGP